MVLLLPFVLALLLAAVQVAVVVRGQVMVAVAAREAARAAAVGATPEGVRAAAVGVGGLDPTRLEVQVTEAGGLVSVTVRARQRTDVAVVGRLVAPVTLRATVVMRAEG